MGFRVVSGYFLDIKWIIRRQYASYIPLHPIWGKYLDYMPVLCRQYMAYLPFTGILPVIHGLLYLNSTQFWTVKAPVDLGLRVPAASGPLL